MGNLLTIYLKDGSEHTINNVSLSGDELQLLLSDRQGTFSVEGRKNKRRTITYKSEISHVVIEEDANDE
ncbi:hypothetical protein [Bacillus atrophaeus]|uniref:hypothetical protein n=1 Tax=Bacillus atrophaeus TaxID=1452 RepID=UPI001C62CFE8|nr:hypothetical protein [Bacillus atrophaeus]QYG88316.1 hypothetical protein HCU65_07415 [Bacillus atrophaeus]